MTTASSSPETFAGDFERLRASLPGAGAPWLAELRDGAIASLRERGFPGARDEEWKYTSVAPILRERLEPALAREDGATADVAALLSDAEAATGAAAHLAVFVDGRFQPSHSRGGQAAGLRVSSLRERLESDPSALEPWLGRLRPSSARGFEALGAAFLDDGAVVEIEADTAVADAVHIVHVSTASASPTAAHPHSLLVAGDGSVATVIEHFVGQAGGRSLTNTTADVLVGRNATLSHVRIQDEAPSAFHVARVRVEQAAGSFYRSHAFAFGAALSRCDLAVKLAGVEASCELSGLYAIDGNRHADNHLMVDHAAPHTNSQQLYKGVLDDAARGVFTGRVVIRPGSQRIRAAQSNPSLLLGDRAVAETRPQLEIYADDVACNHGATIGRLDEDALFYLRSRGIEAAEARRLLVSGFAAEVVGSIGDETLREALRRLVGERVGRLGLAAEAAQAAGALR